MVGEFDMIEFLVKKWNKPMADDMSALRWNWDALLISPHNHNRLYLQLISF